jgi:hypothetical protein
VNLRFLFLSKKNYAKLTQVELSEITGIHRVNITKHISSLSKKNVISTKRLKGNVNYYVLNENLLDVEIEDPIIKRFENVDTAKPRKSFAKKKKNTQVMFSENIDSLLAKQSADNKFKEIAKVNSLLAEYGHSIEDLDLCSKDLIEKGDLRGDKVDRPFSYLASGVFEKILNRAKGLQSNGVDLKKIKKLVSEHGTHMGMSSEISEQLSEKELQAVESVGGWRQLGQLSDYEFDKAFT